MGGGLEPNAMGNLKLAVLGCRGKHDIDVLAVRMIVCGKPVAVLFQGFESSNFQKRVNAIEPLNVFQKCAQIHSAQLGGDPHPRRVFVRFGCGMGIRRLKSSRHRVCALEAPGWGTTTSGMRKPLASLSRSMRERNPVRLLGRGAPMTTRSKFASSLAAIRQSSSRPCLEPAL